MCGIVAVLGRHEVAPLILESLKRLEYRGYDSAGIATLHDGRLAAAPRGRQARRALRPPRPRPDPRPRRHRPHPLGDPRPADRAQRPPPPGRRRRRRPQRHHRELPQPPRRARGRGRRLRDRHRHRDASSSSATGRWPPGLAPVEAARADAGAARRGLCALLPVRGRGRPPRRRPPRLAARGRLRRRREPMSARTRWRSRPSPTASPTSRRATTRSSPAAAIAIFDAAGAPARRDVVHVPIENVYAEKGPYKHFMAKEMHEQPTVIGRGARPLPRARPRRRAAARGHRLRRRRPGGPRRLRHRPLRLPRGEVLVRGHRAAAGRDRGRLRVPLPRAAARAGNARHLRQPVGRDRRHPGRPPLRARGRAGASSRWSTSRPRRSPGRATSPCRSSPGPRSASPRPRPSPAS